MVRVMAFPAPRGRCATWSSSSAPQPTLENVPMVQEAVQRGRESRGVAEQFSRPENVEVDPDPTTAMS